MGTASHGLSPLCRLFPPTPPQVILITTIPVSQRRNSDLKVMKGSAPGLHQEGTEPGLEPKTVYHFLLHWAEERGKREWVPWGMTSFVEKPTQKRSVWGLVRLPAGLGTPDRKGRFPAGLGVWHSPARPRISGRAGPLSPPPPLPARAATQRAAAPVVVLTRKHLLSPTFTDPDVSKRGKLPSPQEVEERRDGIVGFRVL